MITVAESIRGRPGPQLRRTYGSDPGGRGWLDKAPRLADEYSEKWGLETGRPMPSSSGFVLPARAKGRHMILKVFRRPQAARLERNFYELLPSLSPFVFAGDGRRGVLLTERIMPGWEVGDRGRLKRAAELISWTSLADGHSFTSIASQVRKRQMGLPGDLWPGPRVREYALERLDSGPRVALHGRFVPQGGVAESREGWVLLSPRPASGDPAYDAACWAIADRISGSVADNCRTLSEYAGLDEERVRELAWIITVLESGLAGDEHQGRLTRFLSQCSSDRLVKELLAA